MNTAKCILTHVSHACKSTTRSSCIPKFVIQSQNLKLIVPRVSSALYSQRGNDGFDDDLDLWVSPPKTQRHLKFHRSNRIFGSGDVSSRHRRKYRDPYYDEDEEFTDADMPGRSQRSLDVGANLKVRNWEGNLTPIEKNFYVESPSVTETSVEDVDSFYNKHNISVSQGERPLPISKFNEANFPERINELLMKTGWSQPTPIQSLGWPLALSGRNVVGIAQTGSGKTLGFILPALIHIKHQRQVTKGEGPIALILAPTRELAQQIKLVAVQFGKLLGIRSAAVFGGQSKLVQARHLNEGPELVVATPGRLLDFLEMDIINFNRCSYVVLDEADRMLDMGFEPQIRRVLGQIRPDRQMLMWSATWPREIQQLAKDFLGEFTQVNVGATELTANPNITQEVRVCERREKFRLLVSELEDHQRQEGEPIKTLIFTQTKSEADFITHKLRKLRFRALSIHGDKSQLVRDKTLDNFRSGRTEILVATDVASRGLDVNDIKIVINYDYPNAVDDYIHRIGRTGRAEKRGKALTFITDEDSGKLDDLISVLRDASQDVPEELTDLANLHSKLKRKSSTSRPGYHRQKTFDRRQHSAFRSHISGYNRRNSW